MSNPVVVEVLRGDRVELAHRGAGAVVDADGRVAFAFGDVDRPVFPRSAVKAIQALPLIESGAADRLGLTRRRSRSPAPRIPASPRMSRSRRRCWPRPAATRGALECGAHWPLGEAAAARWRGRAASPSALHNNCSGKHAGFVCLACAEGVDPKGYVAPDHPVQRAVTEALADVTGAKLGAENRAVDGCSIPTAARSPSGSPAPRPN